jgi:hypothetical protein
MFVRKLSVHLKPDTLSQCNSILVRYLETEGH